MLITSLETAQLSKEDLKFISTRDINIAQKTLSKTSVPLDILIGQDHLSNIIDRTNPVLQMPSGLILTPTVFGYTISGTSTFTSNTATTRVDEGVPVAATTIILSKNNYKREVKRLKNENFPGSSRTILGIASQRNSNTAISKTESRRRKFRKPRENRYIAERHARHTLFKDEKNTVNRVSVGADVSLREDFQRSKRQCSVRASPKSVSGKYGKARNRTSRTHANRGPQNDLNRTSSLKFLSSTNKETGCSKEGRKTDIENGKSMQQKPH
ncbi:hypothetical protein OESDEN_04278 [Oesophagostomum dentatum]|uniref:Uncharacterized protein n=1 Tax=Oesophagostomum dentatum TaxID=61180 RepID=A0A0B1TIY1_OESDE|nr:hypothetical protein OESDEN_04278 [Oesophagostomum dentatum]